MRHRYIRFFISSTFSDMTRERDLLQGLFDRLGNEYAARRWQIEMVDLRWGVSQEAGLDNKTMRICRDEIARCQQLSPRPNFIILLGERYGWTPLPETISPADADALTMDDAERQLFNRWYRLDLNALPSGEYVLQRRTPPFDGADVWTSQAEEPLCRMFLRNQGWRAPSLLNRMFPSLGWQKEPAAKRLFGVSATEQEIEMGALAVADAQEHVIAYMRKLSGVPKAEEPKLKESEPEPVAALAALRRRVKATLGSENVFETSLSYDQYCSEQSGRTFVAEMERRVRRVVEAAIASYDEATANDEDEEHMQIALDEASHFVGREEPLAYIDDYIADAAKDKPLWVKAHSGSGKSALLAKVAQRYRQSHRVICRFCGQTAQLTDVDDLYRTIDHAIPRGKPSSWLDSQQVSYDLAKFKPERPTLIIIDAINQLDDREHLHFARMGWLHAKLNSGVKVIVSSTDEPKYFATPSFLYIYHLPDMGVDAESMVADIMARRGRRLTGEQTQQLQKVIGASNRSAIYLRILGSYLSTLPSWESLADVPSDLEALVRLFLGQLERPERHGRDLTVAALSLLAIERLGLNQTEMLTMLSDDRRLAETVAATSFYSMENRRLKVPAALWTRLRHDLQPFLRMYNTKGGRLTAIFHSEVRDAIVSYLKPHYQATDFDDEHYYRAILFRHYSRQALAGDRHALLEVFHCTAYPQSPLLGEAVDFMLGNGRVLLDKYRLFPGEMMADFDELMACFDETQRKELTALKTSLSRLPKASSHEQQLLFLSSLGNDNMLRRLASEQLPEGLAMTNLLADHEPPDTTVYALGRKGTHPCMSQDGTRVAMLVENGTGVWVKDTKEPALSYDILWETEVKSLACDDKMDLLLLEIGENFYIWDVRLEQVVTQWHHGEHGWAQISADGRHVLMGDSQKTMLVKINAGASQITDRLVVLRTFRPALHGALSPSGNYMWLLYDTRSLYRTSFNNYDDGLFLNNIQFLDDKGNAIEGQLERKNAKIIVCSDERCICTGGEHIGKRCLEVLIEGKKYYWTYLPDVYPEHYNINLNYNAVISDDGTMLYANHVLYCSLHRLKGAGASNEFIVQNYITPGCVNRSLTLALVGDRVVDLQAEMRRYVYSDGNEGGINSFTASSDGRLAVVSTGKNQGMERRLEVLRVEGERQREWIPPFSSRNYIFVESSRVSPDGSLLATSNTMPWVSRHTKIESELVVFSEKSQQRLASVVTGEGGCVSMAFSEDSNYLVAYRGDHIASPTPCVYLLNRSGELLLSEELDYKHECHGDTMVSLDNRYLFVNDIDKLWAFDLLEGRLVNVGRHPDVQVSTTLTGYGQIKTDAVMVKCKGLPLLTYDKEQKVLVVSSMSDGSTLVNRVDMRPLAASPDGRRIYLKAPDNRLYVQDMYGTWHPELLLNDVVCVMPALDERHVYVALTDHTILLYDVESRQAKQKAYRGETLRYAVSSRGLWTVNERGEPSLFAPDAKWRVNVPAVATFVSRWNLQTKRKQAPTAVCPLCGGVIALDLQTQSKLMAARGLGSNICWESPLLSGHRCPHCGGELKYNPVIC